MSRGMDDTEAIYSVANSLLLQLIAVLHSTIVTSEQLCHPSTLIPSSTIGKHLRHIHDHFRLLLDAMLLQQRRTLSLTSASSTAVPSDSHIADDQPPISFSYDTRSRNLPSETIHAAALESFVSLAKRLEVETEMGRKVNRNEKLILKAVIPYEVAVETTAAREFWFTCLHATHHFALLRVIAVGELGLDIPADFGVAPSTLVSRH